ncbi:unnamed protein product [Cuscuta epithymum]|uniref:BPS1-like protein n=1 Tax=Cuscuta epithymum TaxID=186058 RepID=A0AAV0DHK3_9ASTE|nr:unnamed protein product [Cuscuta epithymum]
MIRSQDSQRPHLHFKNPFSVILPKGSSHLSPRLLSLLNAFEKSLAEKLTSLKPGGGVHALSFSWMKEAMASLAAIHSSVQTLVKELDLPVCGWDEKWLDVYMDNSVGLLDICTAFSSEILRLNQGNLYLRCTVHTLDSEPKQFHARARSSLDGWRSRLGSKNPRIENCSLILDRLIESLKFPKKKDSGKERVLMKALYGVRVVTIFFCSVFATAFSGSAGGKLKKNFEALEGCFWADAFTDLQSSVNEEIEGGGGVTRLKEVENVDASVNKLYPIVESDKVEGELLISLSNATSELRQNADKLSEGLDLLGKEVDGFFRIVLTARDAMLSNIRVGSHKVSKSKKEKLYRGANYDVKNS